MVKVHEIDKFDESQYTEKGIIEAIHITKFDKNISLKIWDLLNKVSETSLRANLASKQKV